MDDKFFRINFVSRDLDFKGVKMLIRILRRSCVGGPNLLLLVTQKLVLVRLL